MGDEPQTGRKDLAARGAQDTPKTIEERGAEAQRWGYACDCGRSGPITCGPMTSLSPGRVLAGGGQNLTIMDK